MTQRAALQSEMDRCVAELKMLGASRVGPAKRTGFEPSLPSEPKQLHDIIRELGEFITQFSERETEGHPFEGKAPIETMQKADIVYHYREIIMNGVLFSIIDALKTIVTVMNGIDITIEEQWMRARRAITTVRDRIQVLYGGIGSSDSCTGAVCSSFISELDVVDDEIEHKKHESDRIEYILNKLGRIGSNLFRELRRFEILQTSYKIKYNGFVISWIQGLATILSDGEKRRMPGGDERYQ